MWRGSLTDRLTVRTIEFLRNRLQYLPRLAAPTQEHQAGHVIVGECVRGNREIQLAGCSAPPPPTLAATVGSNNYYINARQRMHPLMTDECHLSILGPTRSVCCQCAHRPPPTLLLLRCFV